VVNTVGSTTALTRASLALSLTVSDEGISASLTRHGRTVLAGLDLGIRVGDRDLGAGSTIVSQTERTVHESWTARSGKATGPRRAEHVELAIALRDQVAGLDWCIQLRLAKDGLAVRYSLPTLPGVSTLSGDLTGFDLDGFERAWVLDYQTWYETPRAGIDVVALADGPYGFPLLLANGDDHVLVTESAIDGRFSGSHGEKRENRMRFQGADAQVEIARGDVTPWRVFIVGDLADIVESTLVDELAPPTRPELVSAEWVRPGRAAWSWWSDFYSGAQLEQQKRFVDGAAELGWEHLLIDCGWEPTWVPEIVSYASRRGIQVHLWTVWHDLDGPEKLAKLAAWRAWGVAGIKVDFMESESKDRYRWYDSVLQETARLGMMVNFHGSVIPRGWSRTWPQVLGYEAIRGSEYYVFYNDTPLTAEHNVIQPFTRNVVGSMDYTPVAFSAPDRSTSDGHELALSVAFECGITHFADDLDVYLGRPLVRRFLAELAGEWDETLLLSGSPDSEAVLARRSGDRWFIGAIAAGAARTLTVPLHRLRLGQGAQVWAVGDTDDGRDLIELGSDAVDELRIPIAANGGFVAIVSEGPLFRATPADLATPPMIEPKLAPLDSTRTAEIRTDPDASIRVPPGWTAVAGGDGLWAIGAPQDAPEGSLAVVTAERPGSVPLVAHARVIVPLGIGTHVASALPMLSFTNEFGPVERDQSNGGGNPSDGQPMSIAGVGHPDGFGVSTPSAFEVYLGGRAQQLTVSVGVDDETPCGHAWVSVSNGTDELVSGLVEGGRAPLELVVDVAGVEILTLSTREVAEGETPAHVDWASARLSVQPAESTVTTTAGR
jgi:hypothetical protein